MTSASASAPTRTWPLSCTSFHIAPKISSRSLAQWRTRPPRQSPSVENFLSQFGGRIQGLTQSHDLLIQQNWTGVLLESLVHQQLMPFTGGDSARLDVSGPP